MPKFRGKIYNDNVFEKYLKTLPSTKENGLINSAIFKTVSKYGAKLSEQTGGYFITEPIKGRIGGDPVNYDGATDIVSNERDTYFQTKIAVGRANAWGEDDFSSDITGTNFMAEAQEVKDYWDGIKQGLVLSMLKGIFAMNDGANDNFVTKHTYEVAGNLSADDCNKASQKALGDKKANLKVMVMHSAVSTNLEGLQLINFLKYTDKDGIERDLTIGQYNGKLVIVDDEMPVEEVEAEYELTSDVALDNSKTYYTRTGSGTSQSPYVYTAVATPDVDDIATYYEMTAEAYLTYTTYMFANGFFEFEQVGVKTPSELARNATERGGHTDLISRVRYVIVPQYISYKSKTAVSPTNADLETGSNWEVANNAGVGVNKKVVDTKLIPVVRIISRG